MGTKTDLDKAYRRMHTSANSAARSMAIVGNLLHVLFRLPFGAAPAPPEWCPIMEMIVDLATALVKCKNWDPKDLKSPWSSYFPTTKFDPVLPQALVAYPMNVNVPIEADCPAAVEGYVDDGLAITAGDCKQMVRVYECLPLATHVFFRPVSPDEPILRPSPLNEPKYKGECMMAEVKKICGMELPFQPA